MIELNCANCNRPMQLEPLHGSFGWKCQNPHCDANNPVTWSSDRTTINAAEWGRNGIPWSDNLALPALPAPRPAQAAVQA